MRTTALGDDSGYSERGCGLGGGRSAGRNEEDDAFGAPGGSLLGRLGDDPLQARERQLDGRDHRSLMSELTERTIGAVEARRLGGVGVTGHGRCDQDETEEQGEPGRPETIHCVASLPGAPEPVNAYHGVVMCGARWGSCTAGRAPGA